MSTSTNDQVSLDGPVSESDIPSQEVEGADEGQLGKESPEPDKSASTVVDENELVDLADTVTEDEKRVVQDELKNIEQFVKKLKMEDIKNGNWFEKLLIFSLNAYTQKVDAEYFREKYPNRPVDAIVQSRIDLAAKYSAIEGGLTSSAYSGTVAATIGSGGGVSPLTLPAGVLTFVVDMSYLAQAQLKLAWDIAVLYKVPLDLQDPEDLWKFIKIAFAVKAGEGAGNAALKGIPAIVRPIVKKIFSGGTLTAVKSLPVVGKYLLQRNLIKFAIPFVSIPLTTAINYWSTKVSGKFAQSMFRTEAKVREVAQRMVDSTEHHEELLWALWFAMNANGSTTAHQHLLIDVVAELAHADGLSEEALGSIRDTIEIDTVALHAQISLVSPASSLYSAAITGVALGKVTPNSFQALKGLADSCQVDYDQKEVDRVVELWAPSTRNGKKAKVKPKAKAKGEPKGTGEAELEGEPIAKDDPKTQQGVRSKMRWRGKSEQAAGFAEQETLAEQETFAEQEASVE